MLEYITRLLIACPEKRVAIKERLRGEVISWNSNIEALLIIAGNFIVMSINSFLVIQTKSGKAPCQ